MDPWSTGSVLLGALILVATLVDLFATVFVIGGGAGFQSRWVADRAWRLALRLHDPESPRSHSAMRSVGPLVLLLALLVWILEMTLGWTLIFVPDAFAAGSDVRFGDRVSFTAQTVVGRGGNRPAVEVSDGVWELLMIPAGLTGLVVVTLGLAYVLPILAAVVHKRSISATIHALGDTVDAMRTLARGEGSIHPHLVALLPQLTLTAERHRSYPVLHYFHSSQQQASLAPAVAKLSLLLRDGLPDDDRVDASVTVPLARAVHDLVGALSDMGLRRYADAVGSVDAARLERVGIHPQEPASGPRRFPSAGWLEAYVRFDGWAWDEITEGDATFGDASQG